MSFAAYAQLFISVVPLILSTTFYIFNYSFFINICINNFYYAEYGIDEFASFDNDTYPIFYEKQEKLDSFPTYNFENCEVVKRFDYKYVYQRTYNYPFDCSTEKYHPLVYLGTDLKPLAINTKLASLLSEEHSIFYIKNGFVSEEVLIGDVNNKMIDIFVPHYNVIDFENKNDKYQYKTVAGYKYVLFIPHCFAYLFGHYMTDGLMGYMNVPQWIWDLNPVIVQNNFHSLLSEHLKMFGHENVQILYAKKQFIYGEHVFVCASRDHIIGYGVRSLRMLRDKMYK